MNDTIYISLLLSLEASPEYRNISFLSAILYKAVSSPLYLGRFAARLSNSARGFL
ncbi:hypothetical protein [Sinomicrobium sp. M5D2P17]